MAAETKVTGAAVEAAAQAISKRHLSNTGVPFPISACRDDARAALEAGLAAMLEPACYRLHQPNHSSEWFSGVAPRFESKHPAWSIEQAYTIKEPK